MTGRASDAASVLREIEKLVVSQGHRDPEATLDAVESLAVGFRLATKAALERLAPDAAHVRCPRDESGYPGLGNMTHEQAAARIYESTVELPSAMVTAAIHSTDTHGVCLHVENEHGHWLLELSHADASELASEIGAAAEWAKHNEKEAARANA